MKHHDPTKEPWTYFASSGPSSGRVHVSGWKDVIQQNASGQHKCGNKIVHLLKSPGKNAHICSSDRFPSKPTGEITTTPREPNPPTPWNKSPARDLGVVKGIALFARAEVRGISGSAERPGHFTKVFGTFLEVLGRFWGPFCAGGGSDVIYGSKLVRAKLR